MPHRGTVPIYRCHDTSSCAGPTSKISITPIWCDPGDPGTPDFCHKFRHDPIPPLNSPILGKIRHFPTPLPIPPPLISQEHDTRPTWTDVFFLSKNQFSTGALTPLDSSQKIRSEILCKMMCLPAPNLFSELQW